MCIQNSVFTKAFENFTVWAIITFLVQFLDAVTTSQTRTDYLLFLLVLLQAHWGGPYAMQYQWNLD